VGTTFRQLFCVGLREEDFVETERLREEDFVETERGGHAWFDKYACPSCFQKDRENNVSTRGPRGEGAIEHLALWEQSLWSYVARPQQPYAKCACEDTIMLLKAKVDTLVEEKEFNTGDLQVPLPSYRDSWGSSTCLRVLGAFNISYLAVALSLSDYPAAVPSTCSPPVVCAFREHPEPRPHRRVLVPSHQAHGRRLEAEAV